jgi:hypothetical protein
MASCTVPLKPQIVPHPCTQPAEERNWKEITRAISEIIDTLKVVCEDLTVDALPVLGCGLVINTAGELKVKTEDLQGVNITAQSTDPDVDNCLLDATGGGVLGEGCGIDITGGLIIFDPGDVAGLGLESVGTPTACSMRVDAGCGLTFSSNDLVVDAALLAGDGLQVTDTCTLALDMNDFDVGCGLGTTDGTDIFFDPAQVDGEGLETDTSIDPVSGFPKCELKVKQACGIDVSPDGVKVDAMQIANLGLEAVGDCFINVKIGCGLEFGDDFPNPVQINPRDLVWDDHRACTGLICCEELEVQIDTFKSADCDENVLPPVTPCAISVDFKEDPALKITATYLGTISSCGFIGGTPPSDLELRFTQHTLTLIRNAAGDVIDASDVALSDVTCLIPLAVCEDLTC